MQDTVMRSWKETLGRTAPAVSGFSVWRRRVGHYGLALLLVALSTVLRLALTRLVGPGLPTYITFYPFVMLAALIGGWGPGLLATLAAMAVADCWLLLPRGLFKIDNLMELAGLLFFGTMGLFMSIVAELYRRLRSHLEELVMVRTTALGRANEQLQEQAEELHAQAEELYAQTEELTTANEGLREREQALRESEEALRELNATLESRVARRTEELEHRAWQLQKLTLDLTEAEERARKRLAEILHDDLQQVLAAAKFHMSILSGRVKGDASVQKLAVQVNDLLGEAIAKSRSLAHELSAPVLTERDLFQAFEWLAREMRTQHGFTVHLEGCERIEVASEALRVLLYKAAQELLFNAVKHAGVHEATLRLRHRHGRLWLVVRDQGRGFDVAPSGGALGFGLRSLRERVGFLGGRLKIKSAPGRGSIFVVAVPDADVREPLPTIGIFPAEKELARERPALVIRKEEQRGP